MVSGSTDKASTSVEDWWNSVYSRILLLLLFCLERKNAQNQRFIFIYNVAFLKNLFFVSQRKFGEEWILARKTLKINVWWLYEQDVLQSMRCTINIIAS